MQSGIFSVRRAEQCFMCKLSLWTNNNISLVAGFCFFSFLKDVSGKSWGLFYKWGNLIFGPIQYFFLKLKFCANALK